MKHITKSILLLTLLAAVTILAGCSDPNSSIDPASPKGTWVESIDFSEINGFLSRSGNVITLNYNAATDYSFLGNTGSFGFNRDVTESSCNGFEATMHKQSGNNGDRYEEYGFKCFVQHFGEDGFSYISVCIRHNSYALGSTRKESGSSYCPTTALKTVNGSGWIQDPVINDGGENTVKVYKTQDNKIKFFINDKCVHTLDNAGNISGGVGIMWRVDMDYDAASGAEPVKVTYDFKKFLAE